MNEQDREASEKWMLKQESIRGQSGSWQISADEIWEAALDYRDAQQQDELERLRNIEVLARRLVENYELLCSLSAKKSVGERSNIRSTMHASIERIAAAIKARKEQTDA